VYTADGSKQVHSVSPERACHETGTVEEPNLRCYFSDIVSDGKKYVWASVSRGLDKIDVFSIETGALVGSFATCGSPRDIDFQELREEIWVHCSDFSAMEESHMDVFSSVSPTTPITTRVLMHDNSAARSYGKVEVDETLGDIGFATVYGENYIYKIDLANRVVEEQINVGDNNDPKLNGVYEMCYSPVNQHLFLRTQVCCTCGFVGADNLECGQYGSSNITIEGVEYEGQCGRHCVGTSADTIGVYEFDTISNTIVGTHKFDGSSAVDAPFTSPDGQHVVFFGLNGGKSIRILTPGANGELSTNFMTLELEGFNSTISEEIAAYSDFAWIQTDEMNLFIVASSIDFKAAVVDMSKSTPTVEYIELSDMTFPEDARARDRQVEWVEGTDYVWISGRVEKQIYVVDIRQKKLVKTFANTEAYKLVSVVNKEFAALADQLNTHWEDIGVWDARVPEVPASSGSGSDSGNSNNGGSNSGSSTDTESNSAREATQDKELETDDTLSIVAIALSCVALFAVFTNFFLSRNQKDVSSGETLAGKKSVQQSLA